ncbi:MAG: amidase, partial [Planctomycetota bacterium]
MTTRDGHTGDGHTGRPRSPSAADIAAAVRAKQFSASEAVAIALGNVDDNDGLNAMLEVYHERALDQARAIDTRVAAGDAAALPLAGVPVAIKDNIVLSWGRTTAGSKMLANYRSPFSATAAQRLIEAGAIVIGKANCDEFSMGSSGENSAFGPTLNPFGTDRVPGGSSSGSAAAVASGAVP